MKRGKPLKRKTPLKARKGLGASPVAQGHSDPSKPARKPLPSQNRARRAKAWVRQFGSPEFMEFTCASRCVRCGKTPCDPHHEPPRSRGGTWKNVSPVCPECHTLGPDARHNTSEDEFWTSVGRSAEESNRAHHFAFLEHSSRPLREEARA